MIAITTSNSMSVKPFRTGDAPLEANGERLSGTLCRAFRPGLDMVLPQWRLVKKYKAAKRKRASVKSNARLAEIGLRLIRP